MNNYEKEHKIIKKTPYLLEITKVEYIFALCFSWY